MGVTEVVRAAEFALPLLTGIRRRRYRREVVENHEIFHYLRLIEVQKIPAMSYPAGKVCRRIVVDWLPAFEAALEESENILTESPYWERFMRSRQRVVPTHTSRVGGEFFHLEKLIFQSIRDDIYGDKYELLYHIFTLCLLFLKTLIDNCEEVGENDHSGE